MTDEELEKNVEKYVANKTPFTVLDNGERLFTEFDLKLSYIAGAKENGVFWHDLRKDPNDLPKKDVRCIFGYSNTYGDGKHILRDNCLNYTTGVYTHYLDEDGDECDYTDLCWYDDKDDDEYSLDQIAIWCELPTF